MKIKKIGHCCLLIQTNGVTLLTDPGAFSAAQNTLTEIDVILITHEHPDHLHTGSLKEVMKNNPQAKVLTNSGVAQVLDAEGIPYALLQGNEKIDHQGVLIEAHDCKHEEIFEEIGQVQNTGYFIDAKLFYPGDSFCDPKKPVEILALPVAGPWCKIPEAVRYALALKPKKVFPVHDGMLQKERIGGSHMIPQKVLLKHGIEFFPMVEGDEQEF